MIRQYRRVGDRCGWGVITAINANGARLVFTIQCCNCGLLHIGGKCMMTQVSHIDRFKDSPQARGCPECNPAAFVSTKRQPHFCTRCYDMPHTRPAGGCPKCGKPWMPEQIIMNADDRHGWEAWTW